MHPALQAFYDANAERWSDLTIELRHEDGGYLRLFWRTSESFGYNLTAYMKQDDPEVYFESATGTVTQRTDTITGSVVAYAEILDECGIPLRRVNDIEPNTFGAIVWTERHHSRLTEIERESAFILASITRLNPTTIDQPCQVCVCSPCGCDAEE